MSTWIEFRCVLSINNGDHGRCWSDDNVGPMKMAKDTRKSVISTIRMLEKQAKDSGWRKTRKGWICPFCAQNKEPSC